MISIMHHQKSKAPAPSLVPLLDSLCRNLVQVDSSVLAVVVHTTLVVDRCGTDSVCETSLASECQTLLSSGCAANECVFTVEMLGHLLEGSLLSISLLFIKEGVSGSNTFLVST